MGSLARKMQRANARSAHRKPFATTQPPRQELEITNEGIFCDCYGTLFSHSFKKNVLLVEYLNAKHANGIAITLISTNPYQVLPNIRDIGLHPDILVSLRSKAYMHDLVLEELIDDEPNIRAKTVWKPDDKVFHKHMMDFLTGQASALSGPVPIL